MEGAPHVDIIKSREYKTSGKKIKADGYIFVHWLTMVSHKYYVALITFTEILSNMPSLQEAQSISLSSTTPPCHQDCWVTWIIFRNTLLHFKETVIKILLRLLKYDFLKEFKTIDV